MKTGLSAKVMTETHWFVKCPHCKHETDVEEYESGEVECMCGLKIQYDNRDPSKAEQV